jgi:RNA polymerase sigma factor (TIGR02999 family)
LDRIRCRKHVDSASIRDFPAHSRVKMMDPLPTSLTHLMEQAEQGEPQAAQDMLPLVYRSLKALARQKMAKERPGHTLQATALVHEAFLRLGGDASARWSSRSHFYNAAAEAMRRILIEHARARGRVKRRGARERVSLSSVDLAIEADPTKILALDEAICRLQEVDPSAGQIVRLRYYAGLSIEETAAAMDISPRSVKREWAFARMWLYRELDAGAGD